MVGTKAKQGRGAPKKIVRLFHLTPVQNLEPILREGLESEQGKIYAFTDMILANTIAKKQVFTKRYAVLEIARDGITGQVIPEVENELSGEFRRVLLQTRVSPEHLRHVGTFNTIVDRPDDFDYLLAERVGGRSRAETDESFARFRAREAQRKTEEIGAKGSPRRPNQRTQSKPVTKKRTR